MMTEAQTKSTAATPAPLFQAELTPHRSLSPKAFVILMAAVCIFSFTAGLGFFLAGAWPVVGFLGADVLLIYLAFKISYRRAALTETLELTAESLVVQRVTPTGEVTRWRFQPYWLQVMMDDPPSHDSQLTLRSHGQNLTIGSFLSSEERCDLATALRRALRRARCRAAPV
jgi:uncharacterized membrane protein